MAQRQLRVAWRPLGEFTKEVFVRAGASPEDAATEADVLVWANLRGVDSHGVMNIPWYIQGVDIGHIKLKPNIRVLKETPATLLIDADHALGPVVTILAMNRVMDKARQVGIGWAFIRNTNHQGAMGYYPLMAAEKDMAGIAWVCSPANMVPYGAKAPGVSNNPIAISVPAKHHRPLILDMATSIVAGGKISIAKAKGTPLPEGWVVDKEGNPTTDPEKATFLTPVGGAKGSGLALMLECLASVMVDNPKLEPVLLGKEKPFEQGPIVGNEYRIRQHIQNSVVVTIDIGNYTEVERYKEHIDNLIDGLKRLPTAEGFSEVFVPGEPEFRTYDERSQNGIPLPEQVVHNLKSIGERFGIKFPSDL